MGLSEAGSPTNQNRARAETYQSFIQLPCAVATRYEKTACSFMGVLHLAAAMDWLKN
jgi:hypothetical protein